MTTPNKNPVADFRSGEDCRSQAEAKPRGSRRHLVRLHSDGVGRPRGVKPPREKGFTILEVLIGLGILGIVSSAIYFSYANVLDIVQASQYNSAALSIIETEIETVRNMRYEDVGTIGGIPNGILTASRSVTFGGSQFSLGTYVRSIDDPFDGTLGGNPSDPAPADFKLVQFEVTCNTCPRFRVISMASYVAPKNLENTSENGALFINVFDANGIPIPGATVHITNSTVVPPVNITDVTDAGGILQLYDVATSSAGYHIVVSKVGYSTDQTYSPSQVANPVHIDATVAEQQLTVVSLAIDRVSSLTLTSRDSFCGAVSAMDLMLTGAKLIGTAPNVPKYSSTQTTNASGILNLTGLGWDTYTLMPTDTAWDIAGIVATSSLERIIDPATSHTIVWQVASRSGNGLLVSVSDTSGNPINDAIVQVTGPGGYDRTVVTGESSIMQTDWSGDAYNSQSGDIIAGTALEISGSGKVIPGTDWLISNSFDLGTSSVTFHEISWAPDNQPIETDVRFQLAVNNDNATWDFVGPDGTDATFFTAPGQTIPSSFNGKRYLRYKTYLRNTLPLVGPTVEDVSISFSSGCMIPGQAYVNGLETGTYTIEVTRSGYSVSTTAKSVTDAWQRHSVTLSP
jgi:prepilin-type N-terminal cleavage/methylation domain-containing protein